MDVGILISGSTAFSITSLNIWKFTVHALLKPGLENFEHYFTSMWDECKCVVVWAFFGIALLWEKGLLGKVPGGSECKVFAWKAGDLGSVPGLGKSPGEGEGGNRQNRLYLESRTPSWARLWTLSYMPSIYGNDIQTGKSDPRTRPRRKSPRACT